MAVEDAGDVIGWCWGYDLVRPDAPPMLYLHEVAEEHRRHGHGRALLDALMAAGNRLSADNANNRGGAYAVLYPPLLDAGTVLHEVADNRRRAGERTQRQRRRPLHRRVRRSLLHGRLGGCSFACCSCSLTRRSISDPSCRTLAWLTVTATREARRLEASRARDGLLEHATVESHLPLRGPVGPAADELAAQHACLDLVAQIPQRPRRFLLRLALGYSYRAIAAHEGASTTTTSKQIVRAKCLLRALDRYEEPPRSGFATTRAPSSANEVDI